MKKRLIVLMAAASAAAPLTSCSHLDAEAGLTFKKTTVRVGRFVEVNGDLDRAAMEKIIEEGLGK